MKRVAMMGSELTLDERISIAENERVKRGLWSH